MREARLKIPGPVYIRSTVPVSDTVLCGSIGASQPIDSTSLEVEYYAIWRRIAIAPYGAIEINTSVDVLIRASLLQYRGTVPKTKHRGG